MTEQSAKQYLCFHHIPTQSQKLGHTAPSSQCGFRYRRIYHFWWLWVGTRLTQSRASNVLCQPAQSWTLGWLAQSGHRLTLICWVCMLIWDEWTVSQNYLIRHCVCAASSDRYCGNEGGRAGLNLTGLIIKTERFPIYIWFRVWPWETLLLVVYMMGIIGFICTENESYITSHSHIHTYTRILLCTLKKKTYRRK